MWVENLQNQCGSNDFHASGVGEIYVNACWVGAPASSDTEFRKRLLNFGAIHGPVASALRTGPRQLSDDGWTQIVTGTGQLTRMLPMHGALHENPQRSPRGPRFSRGLGRRDIGRDTPSL